MNKRKNSVDILRGIAIICMILGHIYQIWTSAVGTLFYEVVTFISLFSPPFFVLVSGISHFILINKRINSQNTKKEIFFFVFKRAIFIFIVSLIFNLLFARLIGLETNFYFYIIYWSMFQLIAISMIIFVILPFIKRNLRLVLYFILYFSIFIINHFILFYQLEYLYFLIALNTSFPFLPWANLFLFGMVMGDIIINTKEKLMLKFLILFFSIGCIFIINWFIWIQYLTYLSINRFVRDTAMFFILFSLFYYITDIKDKNFYLKKLIIKWGNVSLSIYYLHYGMIVLGLLIIPYFLDASNGIQIYEYLIILFLFLIILEISLRIWEKFDYKYGLEWFMRKFAEISFFPKISEKKEVKDVNTNPN